MFDEMESNEINLSGQASAGTMATAGRWLGWGLLILLAIVTAVHAISITMAHTGMSAAGGDAFAIIRLVGVGLVELFAIATAILLATHSLRAKQKPMAMALEITWGLFALANLVSSFAIEHGGEMPAFVSTWVTYGLPVSALIVGVEFYIIMRLDPEAGRADDKGELAESFEKVKHQARLEVLTSPQMKSVIRQAVWEQLPPIVGRQMNLTEAQIQALVSQAPKLLDLNRNGVPDIQEGGSSNGHGRPGQANGSQMSQADMLLLLDALQAQRNGRGHDGHEGNGRAGSEDSGFLR